MNTNELIELNLRHYWHPCTQMKESLGKSLGLQFGILGEIALAVPENRAAEAEAVILDLDAPVEEN